MWEYVDFWLAAFAGFTAGYAMLLGSYWLEQIFGVIRLDFGQTGMQYVGGQKPGWWIVGILFHLIDSVLLGELYALAVFPLVGSIPAAPPIAGVALGIAFGIVLWFFLAMLIALPFMGAGIFAHKTRSIKPAVLILGLHVVYGALLGFIYLP